MIGQLTKLQIRISWTNKNSSFLFPLKASRKKRNIFFHLLYQILPTQATEGRKVTFCYTEWTETPTISKQKKERSIIQKGK